MCALNTLFGCYVMVAIAMSVMRPTTSFSYKVRAAVCTLDYTVGLMPIVLATVVYPNIAGLVPVACCPIGNFCFDGVSYVS